DCVLLAQLDVPLLRFPGQWQVDSTRLIEVNEERRPYLMHLRLLQEWLLAGRSEALPADVVMDETAFGQSPAAGTSESYSRADHTHGTPVAPGVVGDVVERPSAAGRFGIVAAGTMRGDNGNRQPVYNGLRVTGVGVAPGQISLTFDGYEEPPRVDGRFQ